MNHSTETRSFRARAERRHRQRRRDATRPALRIVPIYGCRARDVAPEEVVADLAALIDAGLVTVVRDAAGAARYDVVDPLGPHGVGFGMGGEGE
jgi:hypothetical protein